MVENMYSHISSSIHHPHFNSVDGVPLLESSLRDPTWMKVAQVWLVTLHVVMAVVMEVGLTSMRRLTAFFPR